MYIMFAEHGDAREICSIFKQSATVKEKWEIIGKKLGLNTETLKSIDQKHKRPEQCLLAVITAWVQRKGPAHSKVTLRTLVKVLQHEKVDESSLVEVIKKKGTRLHIIYLCTIHTGF